MKVSKPMAQFEREVDRRARLFGHKLARFEYVSDQEIGPLWRETACRRCGAVARHNGVGVQVDTSAKMLEVVHLMISRTLGKHIYAPCSNTK